LNGAACSAVNALTGPACIELRRFGRRLSKRRVLRTFACRRGVSESPRNHWKMALISRRPNTDRRRSRPVAVI